jgi:hypothetical protein
MEEKVTQENELEQAQPNGELAVDSLYLQQKGLPRGRP